MKNIRSTALRYGLPLGAFAIIMCVALLLGRSFSIGLSVAILNVGVMIAAAWYAGRGPGLLIAVLFELVIDYLGRGSMRPLQLAIAAGSRMALFVPLVLFASSRKNAETVMQQQREWLRVTLASIGDAVIATDHDGRIRFINPIAQHLTGWEEAEALGQPFDRVFKIVNELTRQAAEDPINKVLRQGRIVGLANHTVLINRDGQEIPIDDSGAPIRDAGGKLAGVVLVFRDITERRAEEEKLAHLASIVASSDDAIVGKSLDGIITTWNQGAERLYGYSAEEAVGKPVSILTAPNRADDFPGIIQRLTQRDPVDHYETTRMTKDGRLLEVSLTVSLITDAEGGIIGASGISRDITDRKRTAEERERLLAREQLARAEAEAANRAKDEFVAMVSHELRTPLNAILGWARMLRTGKIDQQTTERALDTIERNAQVQTQLIEDLLDISRIISGKLRLDVTALELSSVITAAIDSIRPAADAKGIRLQAVLDPRAGFVSGDPGRLQQVAWNLLSNAIKFTPKGGRVQVRLERVNSHVEIVVSDTGKGIKPDFLPYVFDRFRQADSTMTRSQGGLGLGLAIVRNLIELHGGSIRVESDGENQGATFTVELPLMISHPSGRLAEQPVASAGNRDDLECPAALEGLRVLVVDDELDARTLLTAILGHCKANVTAAASAPEALETLEWLEADILVSDIEMPGEDGYSLIRKVRSREKGPNHIPAIALTAHVRIEDRIRALAAGFQTHVGKPVDPVELVAVIASLASRGVRFESERT